MAAANSVEAVVGNDEETVMTLHDIAHSSTVDPFADNPKITRRKFDLGQTAPMPIGKTVRKCRSGTPDTPRG